MRRRRYGRITVDQLVLTIWGECLHLKQLLNENQVSKSKASARIVPSATGVQIQSLPRISLSLTKAPTILQPPHKDNKPYHAEKPTHNAARDNDFGSLRHRPAFPVVTFAIAALVVSCCYGSAVAVTVFNPVCAAIAIGIRLPAFDIVFCRTVERGRGCSSCCSTRRRKGDRGRFECGS